MALSNVSLRVTPERLRQKSGDVHTRVRAMQASYEDIRRRMQASAGYWQGEAGDAHRRALAEYTSQFTLLMQRIGEHVTDLEQMAGVYTQAEAEARELSADLPSDVIV